MKVYYFAEDCTYIFKNRQKFKNVINEIEIQENKVFKEINIIFCSDEYLKNINQEFLNRDYYTDVITFPYVEEKISGDIFVSIERVQENAMMFDCTFLTELHRVMIHGIMHLCGYEDYDAISKRQMSDLENKYLNFF